MPNLVLPQDNAVIDYSIISQIVDALNQQQSQITALLPNTTVGTGTAPVVNVTVPAIGNLSSTTKTYSGTAAKLGLAKITAITATIDTESTKTAPYVWLSKFDGINYTFSLSAATGVAAKIHIIASGPKA